MLPLRRSAIDAHRKKSAVIALPTEISDDIGVIIEPPDLFQSITVVNVYKVDTALLRAVFLARVRCGEELPAVGKL